MKIELFKHAHRHGLTLNSYDIVKLLALLSMIIDHVGDYVFHDSELLRVLGRYAFPAFLFLVGYSANWRIRPDIVIYASLTSLAAALTFHTVFPTNILFGIILTRLAMRWIVTSAVLESREKTITLFIIIVFFYPISTLIQDYGTMCLLFAIAGYLVRTKPQSAPARNFMLSTFSLYILMQWTLLDYSVAWKLCITVLLVMMSMQLWNFRVYALQLSGISKPVTTALLWISHNALFIYCIHISLLMAVESHLTPVAFQHFRWFSL